MSLQQFYVLNGIPSHAVYALGFYLDQQAAKKMLGPKYGGMSLATLKQDPSLCNGTLNATVFLTAVLANDYCLTGSSVPSAICADVIEANDLEKTIRIVITSGMVNHDKFLNGLKDSLVPACQKVRQALASDDPPGGA